MADQTEVERMEWKFLVRTYGKKHVRSLDPEKREDICEMLQKYGAERYKAGARRMREKAAKVFERGAIDALTDFCCDLCGKELPEHSTSCFIVEFPAAVRSLPLTEEKRRRFAELLLRRKPNLTVRRLLKNVKTPCTLSLRRG